MNTGRTSQNTAGISPSAVARPSGPSTLSLQPSTFSEQGLSLVEILVTVALLVVIILGLTAMFNQTRKAFTVGLGNVDYQDAGRTAMDLIVRDLQQLTPSGMAFGSTNLSTGLVFNYTNALNFYADVAPGFNTNVHWPMIAGDATNFSLERLYFVTRYNQQWNAVGYRLVFNDVTNGVGTLYRFSSNNVAGPTLLLSGLQPLNFITDPTPAPASFSRVVDGVVDFRIRAYDRNGLLIPTPTNQFFYNGNSGPSMATGNANPASLIVNQRDFWIDPNLPNQNNILGQPYVSDNIAYSLQTTGDYQYAFYSNAVPAYVEIELGIMESPTLAQLQAFTNTPAAFANYLTNHAGQVHIFRQRIAIAAADPAAYP